MATPPSQSQDTPTQDQRTAEAKLAFTASLNSVGTNLDADLRSRAANLHENAAALDKQEADLKKSTQGLAKQNDQWQKLADQGRDGLKEVGDVQNWAELIERDLLILEETVKLAEERKEREEVEAEAEAVAANGSNGDAGGKAATQTGWRRWF
jgi:hypothetical protein